MFIPISNLIIPVSSNYSRFYLFVRIQLAWVVIISEWSRIEASMNIYSENGNGRMKRFLFEQNCLIGILSMPKNFTWYNRATKTWCIVCENFRPFSHSRSEQNVIRLWLFNVFVWSSTQPWSIVKAPFFLHDMEQIYVKMHQNYQIARHLISKS